MKQQLLLTAALLAAPFAGKAGTRIIAHRGYWKCEGSAQNSIQSLKKAQEIKAYGSEFDVHLTKDGIAVINHDDSIQGLNIEESTYEQLRTVRLANGETLSTLEAYLQQGMRSKTTKLVLEIKPHKSKEAEDKAVATVLDLVHRYKAAKHTEYISFSLNACQELIRREPGAKVAYLRGEIAPVQLREMGFTGLDYHYSVLEKHPEWIAEAHRLGLTVNVWTVNDLALLDTLTRQGVDFITTDDPVASMKAVTE